MKKLLFSLFVFLLFLFSHKVQGQSPDGCVQIIDTVLTQTGHHSWDLVIFYNNSRGGAASIQVYSTCGDFNSICNTVNAVDSFVTVKNIQTASSDNIAIKTYKGSSCEGDPCPPQGPLPVSLVSFSAQKQGNAVVLNWKTSMEKNNTGFAIEKSATGTDWDQMGFVASLAPNGNSDIVLNYSYNDYDKSSGTVQYRLKQIDIDGHFSYSSVSVVRLDAQNTEMSVYPNPSSGTFNVSFKDNVMHNVKLFDASGRLIQNWNNSEGTIHQINNVAPGFYILKATTPGGIKASVQKIVVQSKNK